MALDPRSPFNKDHPLAGKIKAGMRVSTDRISRPHVSMQLAEMPKVTIEDQARQMFSYGDKAGTRVYYAHNGVFNTADPDGRPISFVGGLFKTSDRSLVRFLQHFVDHGAIGYLELEEDAQDAPEQAELQPEHERSQGSGSGNGPSANAVVGQESEHGEESASDPNPPSGPGEEAAGPAVSSEQPDREELTPPPEKVDLLAKLRTRAGTG